MQDGEIRIAGSGCVATRSGKHHFEEQDDGTWWCRQCGNYGGTAKQALEPRRTEMAGPLGRLHKILVKHKVSDPEAILEEFDDRHRSDLDPRLMRLEALVEMIGVEIYQGNPIVHGALEAMRYGASTQEILCRCIRVLAQDNPRLVGDLIIAMAQRAPAFIPKDDSK